MVKSRTVGLAIEAKEMLDAESYIQAPLEATQGFISLALLTEIHWDVTILLNQQRKLI